MSGSALPATLRGLRATGELFARTDIACVTLLLTWQCPAQCGHCVFDSGPHRREVLDVGLAERVITAAAYQDVAPAISFSGGEPFLEYEAMLHLTTFAHRLDCPTEVVTSCSWAKNENLTRERLQALTEQGLRTVCVSWDRFHSPFVKAPRVAAVIAQARALGLRTVVNSAIDPLCREEPREYLARTLGLTNSVLDDCVINPLNVVPVGRARSNAVEIYYPPHAGRGPCALATEVLTVTPTGLLYPCCGSVVGELAANSGFYAIDALEQMSVDELRGAFCAIKDNLFFRLLQVAGPAKLLAMLRQRDPTLTLRNYFNSDCDACLELNRNPEVGPVLHTLLEEIAAVLCRSNPVES